MCWPRPSWISSQQKARNHGAGSSRTDVALQIAQTPGPNRATFSDRAKIISVNVNGYRTREPEIKHLVEKQKHNSILALSDTRLRSDIEVKLEGYRILRSDKTTRTIMATAGGVMIAIPEKWTCMKVNLRSMGDGFESVAAVILPATPGSKPFKLMLVYNHPGNHFPTNLITEFKRITFNGRDVGGFLVGDFNCAHTAFGSHSTNSFGSRFLQLLNDEELIFHPTHSPTYISNATGLANTLDLIISDQNGCHLVKECYVGEDLGSDHFPVITELAFQAEKTLHKRVDLNKWVEAVDAALLNYISPNDIDQDIANVTKIVTECKQNCTTNIIQKRRRLPPEVHQNILLRKAIMRNRKRATSDIARILLSKSYNRVNKKIQQQMQEIKDKEAASLAENICKAENTNTMWKMLRKYKNKNAASEEPEAPLVTPSGRLTEDNNERCQEFARYLSTVHQTPFNPIFDEGFKREIDDAIKNEVREVKTNYIPPIGPNRLQELLAETKLNSAAGEDGVTYELLKRCAPHSQKVFCNILN